MATMVPTAEMVPGFCLGLGRVVRKQNNIKKIRGDTCLTTLPYWRTPSRTTRPGGCHDNTTRHPIQIIYRPLPTLVLLRIHIRGGGRFILG